MLKLFRELLYRLPVSLQIKLKKRVSLLYHDAGIGDTLLVAAVAREIKQKYGNDIRITVNCEKQNLLNKNRYIDTLSNRYSGIDLNYHYGKLRSTDFFDTSLIDIMCKKVGINNPVKTVDLFLTENEIKNAKKTLENISSNIVTIQTTSGSFDAGRKLWPKDYWEHLVKKLNELDFTVIQLGGNSDVPIDGAIHFQNKKTIREAAAIIKESDIHIGIVSSLMHVSEAVKTKAIILFGGFERYSAHQYSSVVPIESHIECSPCGKINTHMTPCPYNNKCMKNIKPDDVILKVQEIIKVYGDINA